MFKTLKHHYHTLGIGHRFLLASMLFLGLITSLLMTIYAETVDFENDIPTMFSSRFNSGNYSNIHFSYGGNNVAGIIFWQENETGLNEIISISSGAQSILCTEKLRGIYYNGLRGNMIRPLDTGNLDILQSNGTDYDLMSLSGGFYTNCSPQPGGGYTPESNEVYGQIVHTIGGQDIYLMAGIPYNTGTNSILSRSFTGNFQLSSGIYALDMFDTYGGIATISASDIPRCQTLEATPLSGAYGDDVTFVCNGHNVSGYLIQLRSGLNFIGSQQFSTGANLVARTTGHTLSTGNYTATCTVLDSEGEVGLSCPARSFSIGGTSLSSGTTLTGTLGFSAHTGFLIASSGGNYYTNTSGVLVTWLANQNASYILSGNFTQSPLSGVYTGTSTRSTGIVLSNISSVNTLTAIYTTGALSYTATGLIFVDTIAPTAPVISTPISGAFMCSSTGLLINRSASTDTGAGLSGYRYEISSNIAMTGIVASGSTTTGTVSISSATISSLAVGTYYLRISAIDMVGNIATGAIVNFTTSPSYCAQGTGIMFVTSTIHLRNVELDTVYRSDPIYVVGLTGAALVSVSKGMLFINTATGGATTGVITSTDALYIELISSDEYDDTVTSYISVAGLTGTFSLTTKKSSCSLSAGERLMVEDIFNNLKDEYDNDLTKFGEFLSVFQNMVEDESELVNSCTLEYLLQLIEDEYDIEDVDTSDHIAPNCKEYSISYDSSIEGYYAPETINRYYFVNRESLVRYLDYYNPGDCHVNTYTNNYRTQDSSDPLRHVAPNGKIYHLVGEYGGYSAQEFATPKYFDSLQAIKTYIDLRNPSAVIRNHVLDSNFIPITYAAPNGKEYKIYKTNRGYMSYKLMKVKYYDTLNALKSYININNPY